MRMTEHRAITTAAAVVAAGLAAFFLILALLLTTNANAMTVVPMSDAAVRKGAGAVVIATVKDVQYGLAERHVKLSIVEALKGGKRLEGREITLVEPGGTVLVVPGAAEYVPGTDVVVALTRGRKGRLRTYQHGQGQWQVSRGLLWDSAERGKESRTLRGLKDTLRDEQAPLLSVEPGDMTPPDDMIPPSDSVSEPFKLFNNVRWFQPDNGQPVLYRLDDAADSVLGTVASTRSIVAAQQAWSDSGASIVLGVSGVGPTARGGCDGVSTIVWNDPNGEIDPPVNCSGVLALGGYCAGSETRVVNGTTFRRIVEGDIVFADGWGPCGFWTEPNVTEVATHELGHTIGLAHSEFREATMYASAHFDGRGAGLRSDDVDGVRFIYPASVPWPTATVTSASTLTPVPTDTPAPTATATPTVTITPSPVPTKTVVPFVVAIAGDYDAYAPGDRAKIVVRSSRAFARVYVELSYGGNILWSREGRLSKNGYRRWFYRVPLSLPPFANVALSVRADLGDETAYGTGAFQVSPASPWSADCHG